MARLDPLVLAQDLIRCPSVTPEEAGALDLLTGVLERLGFTCHRLRFSDTNTPDVENLYARIGTEPPNFCFAGHTDVVPAGDEAAWTHDPFGGEVVDDALHGRGAVDMKGSIAAFVCSVSRFLEARGASFGGSVSLLITGDEEGPSINGTRKVLEWMTGQGEVMDVCLVGEPTNPNSLGDTIKIGRRGSLSGVITVHGRQGHAAYPHLAQDPVHPLLRLCNRLLAPLDDGSEHFQPSRLQVTSVDVGNPTTNIIPAAAHATFNIRFNDHHDGNSLKAWIQKVAEEEAEGRVDLEFEPTGEAFLTPPGPFSDLLVKAVERVTGVTPKLSTDGGTSDARFIKDHCQVAEFGLVNKSMHAVDEQVPVETLYRLTDIYEAILGDYFS